MTGRFSQDGYARNDTPVTAMGIFTQNNFLLCIAGDGDIVRVCGVTRNLDHVVVREKALPMHLSPSTSTFTTLDLSLFLSVLLRQVNILLLRCHNFIISPMPFLNVVPDSCCADGTSIIPSINHKSSSTLV